MNTEQKAKAYDEALKEAVIAHKDEDKHLKATLERIFPALKENEDNRIINCIGMSLTDVNEQRFKDYDTSLKDCLAWLERQGEQKVIETTWKPSDEQMKELKKVVDTTNLDLDSNILWNLYQDLKKLKE